MNKSWDSNKGGRDQWIAWLSSIMREALRTLKPGGHCLVWALPRTSHWTATALENAGFEIRDVIHHMYSADTALHDFLASLSAEQYEAFERLVESQGSSVLYSLFGSGFPKSLDVSKSIDAYYKAEREIIGIREDIKGGPGTAIGSLQKALRAHGARKYTEGLSHDNNVAQHGGVPITAPATDAAKTWSGWGSNLKPAAEHWILCRKPLSERSIAENVLRWGTGSLAIDASRIGTATDMNPRDFDDTRRTSPKFSGILNGGQEGQYRARTGAVPNGRFPANLAFSHSLFCTEERCADGSVISLPCYSYGNDVLTPLSDPSFLLDRLACVLEDLRDYSKACNNPSPRVDAISGIVGRLSNAPFDRPQAVVNECVHVLGLSRFVGSLFDCPSCLRLCDEFVRHLVAAYQDGLPSLLDALSCAHFSLLGRACTHQGQDSAPCILDDSSPAVPLHDKQESNKSVLSISHSAQEHQKSFDRQDIVSVPLPPSEMLDSTPQSRRDAGGSCEKCLDNGCRSGLVGLLGMLICDLACHFLPAEIIQQNTIDINTSLCPVLALDGQSKHSKGHRNKVSDNRSQVNGSIALHDTRSLGMRTPENSYDDQGGASRYFAQFRPDAPPFYYAAKASRRERNAGLDNLAGSEGKTPDAPAIEKNHHPCVKSLSLMQYLIKLITPPNGVVLDMFCGSGSTLCAAIYEHCHFIGIEQSEEYCAIAEARVAYAQSRMRSEW